MAESVEKGKRLAAVPEGYEIYEKPSGQVFCRKKLPILITDEEMDVVKKELAKIRLGDCIVERKGVELIVHAPQTLQDSNDLPRKSRLFAAGLAEILKQSVQYQHVFQFELVDLKKRRFAASRWCFLGGIENWVHLEYNKPLADLAKKYLKHIGKESFYELM